MKKVVEETYYWEGSNDEEVSFLSIAYCEDIEKMPEEVEKISEVCPRCGGKLLFAEADWQFERSKVGSREFGSCECGFQIAWGVRRK